METPAQYPGGVPQESDFLRRYHDAPLALLPPGPSQPVTPSVRAWMERTYRARVAEKVRGQRGCEGGAGLCVVFERRSLRTGGGDCCCAAPKGVACVHTRTACDVDGFAGQGAVYN